MSNWWRHLFSCNNWKAGDNIYVLCSKGVPQLQPDIQNPSLWFINALANMPFQARSHLVLSFILPFNWWWSIIRIVIASSFRWHVYGVISQLFTEVDKHMESMVFSATAAPIHSACIAPLALNPVSTWNLLTNKTRLRMRCGSIFSTTYHRARAALINLGIPEDDVIFWPLLDTELYMKNTNKPAEPGDNRREDPWFWCTGWACIPGSSCKDSGWAIESKQNNGHYCVLLMWEQWIA